jgi:membrane-bound lytic murein transglycosylase D
LIYSKVNLSNSGQNKHWNYKVAEIPVIRLKVENGQVDQTEFNFRKTFRIGRDEQCEVQIHSNSVSRFHAEVFLKQGQWWIRDLNSTNGIYHEGIQISELPLEKNKTIIFGIESAIISFYPEEVSPHELTKKDTPPSNEEFMEHYFGDSKEEGIGEHTRMIRTAFQEVQKKHKKKYILIITLIGFLFILTSIYGLQKRQQVKKQQLLAENIFYSMKSLELELVRLQNNAELTGDLKVQAEVQEYKIKQSEMLENYDQFLKELHIYDDGNLDEVDQLIFRIARIFGECELTMPKDFVGEVKKYIRKWQTTDRLEMAISRANKNKYAEKISNIMLDNDLPPQFFYLALQESDFRLHTVGPRTSYGIAKGIWQFIPQTALKYSLRTGPLVEIEKYDPRDERFNFEKSTSAAANYIKDIYETDAQASGLLVIASYNWGERKVASFIQKMPQNPRERNFWKLLKAYKKNFPIETYNYVFYIFSAAVIGENPQLFGFAFKNPLAHVQENYYSSY